MTFATGPDKKTKLWLKAFSTADQPYIRAGQFKMRFTEVPQHVGNPCDRAVPSSSLGSSARAAFDVLLE